ncbi:dTMP kinase [Chromobacterium subtsugae]|uniref:Thymidylate kinase n=1 Tax=Chromobacterium subtsugae TaxID=251747 RepID=A0ABS7FDB5_9NEIS|nr:MULTISPECIES: dTMP kinase [Chromobacterium]KUM04927.1 thymidylate kinase [Chromobacterium subtsugae]KZE86957.1 thymidylate kinase [Chromobacterium sp. F49]MBW7566778.1 dTMP kinase [Chromobacterium subtsugae]MBW8288083.1 dTMP kinase [Chromobacterium subtsugae]OBU86505.1 thymidylate kinase [Chromobacterium subtsugae]
MPIEQSARRGRFITLEGIDGAGKSTHLGFIRDWLAGRDIDAAFSREPGGTPLSEKIRELLLAPETVVSLDAEALLAFAARQQHIAEVIEPALAAGRWLVSDRFTDSTYAFQGGGRGIPFERIRVLEDWVQRGLQPDLTLLFDLPLEVAAQRMSGTRQLDRFEQEAAGFHQRVRDAYLARAAAEPGRFAVLDSSRGIAEIQADIALHLQRLLERG